MASCNSSQYLVTILAKNFPRSWQDLAKILLRYPWRVDPGCAALERFGAATHICYPQVIAKGEIHCGTDGSNRVTLIFESQSDS